MRLLMLMDPIASINTKKDSSFAMLLEAQRRGYDLGYITMDRIWLQDGRTFAEVAWITVDDNTTDWFAEKRRETGPLDELGDFLLMRKDPPFDLEYINATYMLDRAKSHGLPVFNEPQALRDANEKIFTAWFPQCCPPTLVTRSGARIREFASDQQHIIVKPVDGMGGESIFKTSSDDPNLNVIVESVSKHGQRYIMCQKYIPEISSGDKRILMVHGKPVPYALARIPSDQDFRGNLAKGGRGEGVPLSERDQWIAAQVAPELIKRGIVFAGLDVIGDYLTEVNVTSPTCIRELDAQFDLNISGMLFEEIESLLQ